MNTFSTEKSASAHATMPSQPSVDLSHVQVAFADSRAAVDFARKSGLPENVPVKTLSPALILGEDDGIDAADSGFTVEDGPALGRDTLILCRDIHETLSKIEEFSEAAIAVAQIGILYPSLARVAMAVDPDAYTMDVAVIRTATSNPDNSRAVNIPWDQLLQGNPKLIVVEAPSIETDGSVFHRPETIGFLDRQRLGGWEKIGFQLIQRMWERLPFTSPRGTFLILRENPLLRETALHLAYRGYGLCSLPKAPDSHVEIDPETGQRLKSALSPALEKFLAPRIPEAGRQRLRSVFEQQCATALTRYLAGKRFWTETLDDLALKRPKAVLVNMLMIPETAALHAVCRRRGLPVAAFQHGVAREISQYNSFIQVYFEGNTADYFYAFDPASVRVSEASTFNKSKAIAAGLPNLYWRTGSYRPRPMSAPAILYASTQLYGMAINMAAARGTTDTEMAKTELALLDSVLGRIPHPILYKPYPVHRYLDPDPVLEHASEIKNLKIFQDGDDLRFLLVNCRVVVTSRATSTLGWCIASGKPLVFIDYPTQLPLREDARKALERAIFVFDSAADDHHERLVSFLSQPIEEIERQWAEKAEARKQIGRAHV